MSEINCNLIQLIAYKRKQNNIKAHINNLTTMKNMITIIILFIAFIANAQKNSKLILVPSVRTDVASGKIVTLVADQGTSYFITIEDETKATEWANENVTDTNLKYNRLPGIISFSRGMNGQCKVVINKTDLVAVLKNTFGFTEVDLSKITE